MSWLELDDGILDHPKFIRAIKHGGSEVVHLWLGMRSYCGKLLTDGLIPVDMLDEIRGPSSKKRRVIALKALIDAQLLEQLPDGSLFMHDYLHWSSSRQDVLQRRESSRIRQRRNRGTDSGVPVLSRRDIEETSLSVTHPRARLPSDPLPLRSPPNSEGDPERVPPQGREREPRRFSQVGAITPAFLTVFDGYPNQNGKARAAQEFQDLAPAYGGEEKFSAQLLVLFKRGFLRRHPYDGEARFVPTLATVLAERRFEEKWNATPSNGVPAEIPDLPPGVPRPPRPPL